jgi:hypothetical protein
MYYCCCISKKQDIFEPVQITQPVPIKSMQFQHPEEPLPLLLQLPPPPPPIIIDSNYEEHAIKNQNRPPEEIEKNKI